MFSERWDYYDNLPKEERDKLKYGLFGDAPWSSYDAQSCATENYGPDHPQAQGDFLCPLKP